MIIEISAPEQRRRRTAVSFALVLSGASMAAVLARDLALGGHPWRQGDHLINSGAGPIRRGLSGDAAILISDFLGMSPLIVVVAVQALLVAFIWIGIWILLGRIGFASPISVLVLSPFFITFMSRVPGGGFRKEIWILAALTALATLQNHPRLGRITAFGFFSIAVFFHEGLTLFTPVFVLCIFLADRRMQRAELAGWAVAFILIAGAAAVWAMTRQSVDDSALICEALTIRGLRPHICEGAIAFMESTREEALHHVGRHVNGSIYVAFTIYLSLFFVTVAVLFPLEWDYRARFLLTLATFSLFLPLWIVGVDWGRWLFFSGIATVFPLMIAASREGQGGRKASGSVFWGFFAFGFFWSIPSYTTLNIDYGREIPDLVRIAVGVVF